MAATNHVILPVENSEFAIKTWLYMPSQQSTCSRRRKEPRYIRAVWLGPYSWVTDHRDFARHTLAYFLRYFKSCSVSINASALSLMVSSFTASYTFLRL